MSRTPTSPRPPLIGPGAVPGYRLERLVAERPGLATSYRARRLASGTDVLLTVIAPELSADRLYRERFERSAQLLSGFSHPATSRLLDAGACPAGLFIVLEEPGGVALSQLISRDRLPPARILLILEPLARLLEELRASRMTVGCPTPAEIVVGADDRPRVTHLGFLDLGTLQSRAEILDEDVLSYMAPEQLRGLPIRPRTDVYDLAVVVFEALTATRPFRWRSGVDPRAARRALNAAHALPPPAVSARRPGLGLSMDALLKSALAEDPMSRPASPTDFMERFRRAAEKAGGNRDRPARAPATHRRGPGSYRAERRPTTPAGGRVARGGDGKAHEALVARPRTRLDATPASSGAGRAARFGRRSRIGLTAAAVLLAAVTGSTVALSDDPRPQRPELRILPATSGSLSIRRAAGWRGAESPPRLPGMALRDPIVLASSGGPGRARPDDWLVAGMVDRTDERLLSPALVRRFAQELVGEPVHLGSHAGYRYRDLPLDAEGARMTVYAVPTDSGVATVACVGPATASPVDNGCEAMATTLEVRRGRVLPLGPSARFARRVSRRLGRLDERRRTERNRLTRARTVAGQGRRANDLARAFKAARRDIARVPLAPGTAAVQARLVAGLDDVAGSYAALAAGARSRDRRAYGAARVAVSRTERGLLRTLSSLRRLGYRVG